MDIDWLIVVLRRVSTKRLYRAEMIGLENEIKLSK